MRTSASSPRSILLLATLVVVLTASPSPGQSGLDYRAESLPRDEPQAVYSADPSDAWNRIFHALFTRTLPVRLSGDFSGSAPLGRVQAMGFGELPVSLRTFDRIEGGDRAVEPLYPFPHSGARGDAGMLDEPRFTRLTRALDDAMEGERPRSPLTRALLQSDLWAAHDVLTAFRATDGPGRERKEQVLGRLARAIKMLALTPREIEDLPDNLALARLPFDPFGPDSGWIEVEYLPDRIHEDAADFRRVARVFLKPPAAPRDQQRWLDDLRRDLGRFAAPRLDASALVVQLLLIDADGAVVPTRLTHEVQVRTFPKGDDGKPKEARVAVAELNRQSFRLDPEAGGLRRLEETSPIYLPSAGNDYGFASSSRDGPILVPLRKQCQSCHGEGVEVIMTFSVHDPEPPPPVRILDPRANERARHVAGIKVRREDFRELKRRWDR